MNERWVEFNIDGMIGPTHHYGGLGVGNVASEAHRSETSHPRAAALEGIAKMRRLHALGIPQFYLPPPTRPNWNWLRTMGFVGTEREIHQQCWDRFPRLLSAALSSAFMWTANAATVSAGVDTTDHKSHFVIANLSANLHRMQEAMERGSQLRQMLERTENGAVSPGLPPSMPLRDEGAANVMRLQSPNSPVGFYVFVYGDRDGQGDAAMGHGLLDSTTHTTHHKRVARQTRLASELVARQMRLGATAHLFVPQSHRAIDAGVFHNDVIATSHEDILLVHASAFENQGHVLSAIRNGFEERCHAELNLVEISEETLSLQEAVRSYLFNSQIVTIPDGTMRMICPEECQGSAGVQSALAQIQGAIPRIAGVEYLPLKESMKNGGGPACLRLRAYLPAAQIASIPASMRVESRAMDTIVRLIEREYPQQLHWEDFQHWELIRQCESVAEEIQRQWLGAS